jgi:hypothetical protein
MATNLKDVAASALEMGRDVKDSVAQLARSTSVKIDTAREQTSDTLHSAAESVRRGSARLDVLAGGAASRLDTAATTVKDADFKGLCASARRFGQNNLTLTLLVAAAAGLWAGLALSRGTRA